MEYTGFTAFDDVPTTASADSDKELKKANIFYVIMFILISLLAFGLYRLSSTFIGKIINTFYKDSHLIGISAVARTTCAMAIWFLIHSLVMLGNKNLTDTYQYIIHTSYKFLHSILFILIFVAMLYVPEKFFSKYMTVTKFTSGVYLIMQIYFLIDFFYYLNEKWVKDDNVNYILTLTGIMTFITLAAYGVCYYYFCPTGCTINTTLVTLNLVLCIVIMLAAAFIEHGSIFTASLIICYTSYLTVAGLMCDVSCNTVAQASSNTTYTVFASLFTLAWAGYSAFTSTYNYGQLSIDGDRDNKVFSLSFFHFVFAMASTYVTMIITHWGSTTESVSWSADNGQIGKWVNFATSWLTMIMYVWTLIAPMVCPNRDFSWI